MCIECCYLCLFAHGTDLQGSVWVDDEDDRMPSSGLIATLMMIHACDSVDLYGTSFVQGIDSYHYWEDSKGWPEV